MRNRYTNSTSMEFYEYQLLLAEQLFRIKKDVDALKNLAESFFTKADRKALVTLLKPKRTRDEDDIKDFISSPNVCFPRYLSNEEEHLLAPFVISLLKEKNHSGCTQS